MKVLHISTNDIQGGASRGSYSLHRGLLKSGIESLMLVATKTSDDFTVVGQNTKIQKVFNQIKPTLDHSVLLKYPNRSNDIFSPAWVPSQVDKAVTKIAPDIIHLHWICNGFLRPETFGKFNNIPIVWTLRDMWPFTGGCHYSQMCEKYKDSCGACPKLGSQTENDLSRKVWKRKHKSWQDINMTIVPISHWLADCARSSSLFQDKRIEVIHNALNESMYKPISKNIARNILNINQNKNIILFGALKAVGDTRKGFQYLASALKKLSDLDEGFCKTTELLVFGSSEPNEPPELGMIAHYMGVLNDDITLALAYSAADVMITPSTEEAFGKTAMESLACGTPVVCFDTTGLKDIVEHKRNGYRAKCFSSDDLARGIAWVLEDKPRWVALSQCGREKVENDFTVKAQAEKYISLYQSLITNK
ncbi:MAG: glycosyltransferase family 4 protein, partial [Dolichospermum sp.]